MTILETARAIVAARLRKDAERAIAAAEATERGEADGFSVRYALERLEREVGDGR